jgi:hypothetical protein
LPCGIKYLRGSRLDSLFISTTSKQPAITNKCYVFLSFYLQDNSNAFLLIKVFTNNSSKRWVGCNHQMSSACFNKKYSMIFIQISSQLKSLNNLLVLLNDQQYNQKIASLGNASIGGHTRHIIELLKCAIDGYNSGIVDYLNRVRNLAIETDKVVAMQELSLAVADLKKPDKEIKLIIETGEEIVASCVFSTYFREIIYNTEHAIHHLALIKVALREMKLEIVGDDFGMAYSTIKYLASQNKAQ